jgi:hypothetical protein
VPVAAMSPNSSYGSSICDGKSGEPRQHADIHVLTVACCLDLDAGVVLGVDEAARLDGSLDEALDHSWVSTGRHPWGTDTYQCI